MLNIPYQNCQQPTQNREGAERSQIDTVQAVSYIGVRSPSERPIMQLISSQDRPPMVLAAGTYLKPCTVQHKGSVDQSV